jgi:hypothetical protein
MATCWCFRFIKLLFHCFLVSIIIAFLSDIQDFQKRDKKSETKIMFDKTIIFTVTFCKSENIYHIS